MNFSRLGARPLLLGFIISALGFAVFAWFQKWNGIELALAPDQLLTRMSPLILAATFIERAVEILISPWRDTEANKLDRIVTAIKGRPNDPTTPLQNAINATDLQAATEALDEYRGKTQQYAFAIGLFLSLCASIAGVRALWPFVAHPDTLRDVLGKVVDPGQQAFFRNFDVVITTTLLAGGADGIHSIISSITSFFPRSPNASKS
ncbi:hypothetical protein [Acidicapsa ligni]|uniref:hypothetical protein n=1 Tax=Acidicapsa ligni TaxID=542300 RepID=UPI0021E02AD5|nr:hypothetical protein [Acidicapsa ligni]